jgi:dihydroxy-acid dehydratase
VGHISPEAAEGGPIAFIENGDPILIDLKTRSIELLVNDSILAERKKSWKKPEPKIQSGYLAKYAKLVTSASTGGIMKI